MKNINFTCPFCSLLCDDIQLEAKNNNLKSLNSKCPILVNSLKRKVNEQFSRIKGEKTNISQAIEELSFLIKKIGEGNNNKKVFLFLLRLGHLLLLLMRIFLDVILL